MGSVAVQMQHKPPRGWCASCTTLVTPTTCHHTITTGCIPHLLSHHGLQTTTCQHTITIGCRPHTCHHTISTGCRPHLSSHHHHRLQTTLVITPSPQAADHAPHLSPDHPVDCRQAMQSPGNFLRFAYMQQSHTSFFCACADWRNRGASMDSHHC